MLKSLVSFLLFAVLIVSNSAAFASEPKLIVEKFQEKLVSAMQMAEKGAPVQDRYEFLVPPVTRSFHLPLMSRIVVGTAWDQATNDDHRQLVAAFSRLNVLTLASLLRGYDGERFETVGTSAGPQNTTVVTTRIHVEPGESHELSYVLHEIRGRLWIIDVIVDGGISELTTRRSEYRKPLSEGGIPALITVLKDRADKILKPE